MNAEGGVLFPRDSLPVRKLEEYATKLWYKHESLVVPLYQDNGVYNMYVKPSTCLSSEQNSRATSIEAASALLPLSGGQPASSAVRPQVRSAQECPAELAANDETGERLDHLSSMGFE
eukprot:4047297-Amphidinium_carterae.1